MRSGRRAGDGTYRFVAGAAGINEQHKHLNPVTAQSFGFKRHIDSHTRLLIEEQEKDPARVDPGAIVYGEYSVPDVHQRLAWGRLTSIEPGHQKERTLHRSY